jgi:uncharacterized protein (PEP-CTERM system associated)
MDITERGARLASSLHVLVVGAILAVDPGTAIGGEWNLVPSITVQETYTDNVRLAVPGSGEGEFVTDLSPGISLRGRSARIRNFAADYQLQKLLYAGDAGLNNTNHLASLEATGELFRQHLFVDVSSRYRPQNVSSFGGNAIDNISVTTDRVDTLTYRVSPYWSQRFTNIAEAELRYTFDEAISSGGGETSRSNEYRLNVKNGSRFARINWLVDASERNIDSDSGGETIFRNVRGRVHYLASRHWGMIGQGGYDENEVGDTVSGVLWGVGASWSPNARTYLEGVIGERFFGRTVEFNFRYRNRRIEWIGDYTEEPTTTRDTLFEQEVFALADAFGNPILNPTTGQPVLLAVNQPRQTTAVILHKRFKSTLRYIRSRDRVDLNVADSKSTFDSSGDEENHRSAELAWSHDLGPHTTSRIAVSWNQSVQGSRRDDQYVRVDVGLTRVFGRELEGTVGARWSERESNIDTADYRESRLFAALTRRF